MASKSGRTLSALMGQKSWLAEFLYKDALAFSLATILPTVFVTFAAWYGFQRWAERMNKAQLSEGTEEPEVSDICQIAIGGGYQR